MLNPKTMIGVTKVFHKKSLHKFIKYRIRDKPVNGPSIELAELGIFPLTYSFNCEFFNKCPSFGIC